MAAEGYVRASGKTAAVCVTTGPGGTNAITGVLGAFQDNYPMVVISGQVRYETTAESTGLPLRFMGEQEHNIIETVKPLTKYAVIVKDPMEIRRELEKVIYLANNGRKAPCWIDIPLNVQSALVEEDDLQGYTPETPDYNWAPEKFLNEIRNAKRPVILTGSAIRSAGCVEKFRQLAEKMNIPVLAATYNADLFAEDMPSYYGNFGIIGGRSGNFIVQNADLVIGMGCRMTYRHTGFNYTAFSPNSRKMVIDVDPYELQKPTMNIDVPFNADIKDVVDELLNYGDFGFGDNSEWLKYCDMLKEKFPVYLDRFNESKAVNPYFFIKNLREVIGEDGVIVLGNSSIAGHILQIGIKYPEQRIINNMNCGSMGYDLPAAIGAGRSNSNKARTTTLVTGDGSIMLNLQELQTLKHYNIPLKIFICSNGGYRAIVRTQQNMFEGRFVGCSAETGVSIPDFEKIANAFDIPFVRIKNHSELKDGLEKVYSQDGYVICELFQDTEQLIEPRVMSKKLPDGRLVSAVIDDMFPFLSQEVYDSLQFGQQ
jgi:acetolactate synthase-1/2/3 large subunit